MKKPLEKRYGTRTVLGDEKYHITPKGRKLLMILCKCQCGVEKYVQRQHLLNGSSKNCGCLKQKRFSDLAKQYSTKHGMEGSTPYRKYCAAKARCENPNNDSYYRYGGRGIKMLRKTFEEFWRDMGDSYNEHVKIHGIKNTTLDRIDVNGHYCKENCRWATRLQQCNNMSTNHIVEYKGEIYTLAELCNKLNKKYGLVFDRINAGRKLDDALYLPLCKNQHDYKRIKQKKG